MALGFYDDFNRADGPLGSGWYSDSGIPSIVTNRAAFGAQVFAHPTDQPLTADSCQRTFLETPTVFTKTVYMRFRSTLDGNNYYQATFAIGASSVTVSLQRRYNGVTTTIGSNTVGFTWQATIDLQASVVGNQVYAWVYGFLVVSAFDAYLTDTGYNQIGSGSNTVYLTDYSEYDLLTGGGSLTVTSGPDANGRYTLTALNNGADWTPGTPGAPVFTAPSGSIYSQTIVDTDTATIVYQPPDLDVRGFIYDPQNDWNYPLDLALTMEGVGSGGGGTGLTETQAQTIADLAVYLGHYDTGSWGVNGIWLKAGNAMALLGSAYGGSQNNATSDLLHELLNDAGGLQQIRAWVSAILDYQNLITNNSEWTLGSIRDQIRGQDLRDLSQVYDYVGAVPPTLWPRFTDIDNAIAAIRTASQWTLEHVRQWILDIPSADVSEVLNQLALIRTANQWTLGHVMDAIDAISIPDPSAQLTDIHDHVTAIPTNPITSLQPVLDAIAAVRGTGNPDIRAVLTAIASIPTNPITNLQPVLDAITTAVTTVTDDIAAVKAVVDLLLARTPAATAPVWPGLSGVNLGTPVALALTFASSTPCDGLLVSLTGYPVKETTYDWGGVVQHPRAGYVSFVTDNGEYENPVPFTFPGHLVVPLAMAHADGFIGRARAGVTGTVTPWSYKTT